MSRRGTERGRMRNQAGVLIVGALDLAEFECTLLWNGLDWIGCCVGCFVDE
jgi:hypothetical protein